MAHKIDVDIGYSSSDVNSLSIGECPLGVERSRSPLSGLLFKVDLSRNKRYLTITAKTIVVMRIKIRITQQPLLRCEIA